MHSLTIADGFSRNFSQEAELNNETRHLTKRERDAAGSTEESLNDAGIRDLQIRTEQRNVGGKSILLYKRKTSLRQRL